MIFLKFPVGRRREIFRSSLISIRARLVINNSNFVHAVLHCVLAIDWFLSFRTMIAKETFVIALRNHKSDKFDLTVLTINLFSMEHHRSGFKTDLKYVRLIEFTGIGDRFGGSQKGYAYTE